jgi:hypothetical protein
MRSEHGLRLILTILAIALVGGEQQAAGECPALDFTNLAINTPVTGQYAGVTFSVQEMPTSCGASYGRIVQPANGTASPIKAVCVDGGATPSADCEFHPQWLRLVFDDIVHDVSFSVGPGNTEDFQDYTIRAYSTTSGTSGLILTQTVTDAGDGVFRVVNISSTSNIRRVEIEGRNGAFAMGIECIDDLQFALDTTPPTAEIDAPAYEGCVCASVQVRGLACDDDDTYASDRLEYRAADAAPDEPWVLIGEASSPVCTSGLLYNWNTSGVPGGRYFLKLTVVNECGLESTDVTVAYVDRVFDTLEMREPDEGDIVGGKVCIDGTAWDFRCFDSYSVMYKPTIGGTWQSAGASGVTSTVINDPLANWNTSPGTVPDGSYLLGLSAADVCDIAAVVTHTVIVDNTPPIALITSLADCPAVEESVSISGTASDTNLASWSLHYAGNGSQGWTLITSSSSSVVNGLLAEWDTSTLEPCTYVLRLRVADRAVVNCDDPHVVDYYAAVNVGLCGDFDTDNDGDVDLIDYSAFLNEFTGPLP